MIEIIKKHNKKIIIICLIMILYTACNSRLIMYGLPKGEYISSLASPNKNYILNAYRYSGGATMDWSLRVELENNKTKKKINIYYKYHQFKVDMKWIDNENVEINGIKLNIYKDYYKKEN